jgi:acetyl esterase/lipase
MSREQRRQVERLLRESPLDIGGDVAVQRPILERMMTAGTLPADVRASTAAIGGVPVLDIRIDGPDDGAVLLFLHGGGYALGSAAAVAGLGAELARRARCRVVCVDYRLAPENPFPAAVDDALAVYRGLLDRGVPCGAVAVGGESAGGGLAVAAMLAARTAGLPQPAAVVVCSPWADLTVTGGTATTKAAVDPALTPDGLRRRAREYAGAVDPADPLLSPVFADLGGLAPLLIQVGSHEILLDDAVRLAGRAAEQDVEVTLEVTPEVPHVFQGFAGILDEAGEALDRAAAFLRTHLDPTPAVSGPAPTVGEHDAAPSDADRPHRTVRSGPGWAAPSVP